MKILFLHGWNSVPGSVKPTYLLADAEPLKALLEPCEKAGKG
jgi:hypothetical protein